jgi:hypothetical protein
MIQRTEPAPTQPRHVWLCARGHTNSVRDVTCQQCGLEWSVTRQDLEVQRPTLFGALQGHGMVDLSPASLAVAFVAVLSLLLGIVGFFSLR